MRKKIGSLHFFQNLEKPYASIEFQRNFKREVSNSRDLPLQEIETLRHPEFFIADLDADIHSQKLEYNIKDRNHKGNMLSRFFIKSKKSL